MRIPRGLTHNCLLLLTYLVMIVVKNKSFLIDKILFIRNFYPKCIMRSILCDTKIMKISQKKVFI